MSFLNPNEIWGKDSLFKTTVLGGDQPMGWELVGASPLWPRFLGVRCISSKRTNGPKNLMDAHRRNCNLPGPGFMLFSLSQQELCTSQDVADWNNITKYQYHGRYHKICFLRSSSSCNMTPTQIIHFLSAQLIQQYRLSQCLVLYIIGSSNAFFFACFWCSEKRFFKASVSHFLRMFCLQPLESFDIRILRFDMS